MNDGGTSLTEFAGTVTIITGGVAGIGEAVAYLLASRGGTAVVWGRNATRIAAVSIDAESRRLPIFGELTDVTREPDVDQLITSTLEHFGRIDGLVWDYLYWHC